MASYHFEVKSGKKGTAEQHARYISRKGHYQRRDDLLDSGHGNMPSWATLDPSKFWSAADENERANGAAYRELVIALPNELTPLQNRRLAEKTIALLIDDKPFQYAIHNSRATLGEVTNTHLHVMFSDRLPDGIERSSDLTFARYNSKSPQHGGCKKDSGGKSRNELRDDLIAKRKQAADIQNATLLELGIEARVDHRSNRARGLERSPEHHLGPVRINRMTWGERAEYVRTRDSARTP